MGTGKTAYHLRVRKMPLRHFVRGAGGGVAVTLVAVVSDLHTNSTVGLCPPSVNLDDGGTYRASDAQQWIWRNWLDYWQTVKNLKKRTRLIVVLNGDIIDGDHHDTPQIISRNMSDQHRICIKALEPIFALKPHKIFVIRGTEAHVGKSGQNEERIAADIGAEVDPITDTASWWWLPLDVERVRFDIAHHGRMGGRPWTRANAVQATAAELTMRYAERGDKLPDLAIRSHLHQHADSYDNYPIRVLQTASWQLSTAFGHRIAPGAMLPVGGLIFDCRNGEYTLHKCLYTAKQREFVNV